MEIYLMAMSLIAGICGLAFVVLYSSIANLRDRVAQAAWLSGVCVVLLSVSSFLLMLGAHARRVRELADEFVMLSRWFAAAGFTVAALAMIGQVIIVCGYVKMHRRSKRGAE